MLCVILLIIMAIEPNDGKPVLNDGVMEMRALKACLHPQHAEQIAFLFPGVSMDRDRREARSLEYLARLLQAGTEYCDAYEQMASHAMRHILQQISQVGGEKWDATLRQFRERKEATQHGCVVVEQSMSKEERTKYSGVLSPLITCLNRAHLLSIKSALMDAYRDEEEDEA